VPSIKAKVSSFKRITAKNKKQGREEAENPDILYCLSEPDHRTVNLLVIHEAFSLHI